MNVLNSVAIEAQEATPAVPPAPIKIALIEDDATYRETLVRILESTPGCRCVSAVGCAEDALYDRGTELPDVMLVDLQLPGMTGMECIRRLKRILPGIQFLAITAFDDPQRVFEAIRAGASGYLVKSEPIERIREAVREVAAGGAAMSPHIARMVLQALYDPTPGPAKPLSAREEEILNLARMGHRYAEIAAELRISRDTVRKHFNNIYQKLHVHSKAEAVAKTRWLGFGR